MLYNLRFLLTGDMMGCWSDFGGLAGQLNHLSIVLHLAITENVTLALIYDQELKQHAQRLARRRDEQVDFYQLFSLRKTTRLSAISKLSGRKLSRRKPS